MLYFFLILLRMLIKEFLANVIYLLHLILFIPILLTFGYPSGSWLKYNMVIIPLILMDWNDQDDQCSLTSLEAKLRGTWKKGSSEESDETPAFFQPLLNKILKPWGKKVTRQTAGKINILLFLTVLLVSCIRYFRYKKISLLPRSLEDNCFVGMIGIFALTYCINFFYKVQPQDFQGRAGQGFIPQRIV